MTATKTNKGGVNARKPRASRPHAGREKPNESPSRLAVLERENRILSAAVDSLRGLTAELGLRVSELTARLERLETPSQMITQPAPPPMTGPASRANGLIDPPSQGWGA